MKRLKRIFLNRKLLILATLLISLVVFFKIKYSFSGHLEQVTFESDIPLEGALLLPDGPGPHPAVLMLHGAGGSRQPYDKMFFRVHANEFLKRGFAVLVYTKRGSGNHEVDYRYFTYQDLKNDAYVAISYLRSRPEIDQQNVGILSISESGWFAPELAALDGNIRFLVNLVSSPFDVRTTIAHEVYMDARADGFTDEEIENEILPIRQRVWQFYIDVAANPMLANSEERTLINQELTRLGSHERYRLWFEGSRLCDYDAKLYKSRASNYLYDPMPFIEQLDVPMYYVLAGQDKNIPTARVADFFNNYQNQTQKDISVTVYPEATHYLNKWGLGDGPWVGLIPVDDYVNKIADWSVGKLR